MSNLPFYPRSRSEALGAPLEAVRLAAAEDRAYLFGIAKIVADTLAPPEAAAEASDPDQTQTSAEVRRQWQNAIQTRKAHA